MLTPPVELGETFCPVKWSCRAPLPSGKLCPRSDRKKCPLHGPIVARNELGKPEDPSSLSSSIRPAIPDWQEPALLAEIKVIVKLNRFDKNSFRDLKIRLLRELI